MKKLSYYLTMTPFKWDFILFPVLTVIMDIIIQLTDVSFDVRRVLNIELWVNSFMITFLTFMVFQVIALNFKHLQRFKYTWSAISFAFSTFLGGALSYAAKESIKPENVFYAIITALIFGSVSLYAVYKGANLGEEKANKAIKKAIDDYNESIDNMTDDQKKALIYLLNEALNLDDFVFKIIVDIKNKDEIKDIVKDIEKSREKSKKLDNQ